MDYNRAMDKAQTYPKVVHGRGYEKSRGGSPSSPIQPVPIRSRNEIEQENIVGSSRSENVESMKRIKILEDKMNKSEKDVSVLQIRLEKVERLYNELRHQKLQEQQKQFEQQKQTASVFTKPDVPFKAPIPEGIQTGCTFNIDGTPKPNRSRCRFFVNFCAGDDISFHFDVRILYENDHDVVVRNHLVDGIWGKEERSQSYFPFAKNVPFTIQISVEHQSFKVAVNNHPFTEFQHRMYPINRVNVLEIRGDVTLTKVCM